MLLWSTNRFITLGVRPVEQRMAPLVKPGDPFLTFWVSIDGQTMKSLVREHYHFETRCSYVTMCASRCCIYDTMSETMWSIYDTINGNRQLHVWPHEWDQMMNLWHNKGDETIHLWQRQRSNGHAALVALWLTCSPRVL